MIKFKSTRTKLSRKRLIPLAVFFVCNGLIVALHAGAKEQIYHTSDEIRETAKIFLEKMTSAADIPTIDIQINQLDPRLRLRRCSEEMKAFIPSGSRTRGKMTVAVSCSSPVNWKVLIAAEIAEYAEVIVASRTLARKTVITQHDITRKRVNISTMRKVPILSETQVIGSTMKRNVRNDSVIFEDSICMVCRGDNVHITAKSDYFSINMEAVALADARIGENTLVRNKQSKRSFTAKVVSKNRLVVTL
ncbi:MAG: flagellar basal body P-ring formation protein FlgA [Kangiellaceae bacterium]|nr:flagellar basal body P-ring formation protein FlgA [Kangiellaceae bacterium]